MDSATHRMAPYMAVGQHQWYPILGFSVHHPFCSILVGSGTCRSLTLNLQSIPKTQLPRVCSVASRMRSIHSRPAPSEVLSQHCRTFQSQAEAAHRRACGRPKMEFFWSPRFLFLTRVHGFGAGKIQHFTGHNEKLEKGGGGKNNQNK